MQPTENPSADGGLRSDAEAEYTLESPVMCPICRQSISSLKVIRMLRTKVNFTSTLPRRGRVVACPRCSSVLSGELGALS